jgi:hypothetical protein
MYHVAVKGRLCNPLTFSLRPSTILSPSSPVSMQGCQPSLLVPDTETYSPSSHTNTLPFQPGELISPPSSLLTPHTTFLVWVLSSQRGCLCAGGGVLRIVK